MNIEMKTTKGMPVTIIHDGGAWIHPTALHTPKYVMSESSQRILGPIRSAVEANELQDRERSTYSKSEAKRWAEQIVNYYERMGY